MHCLCVRSLRVSVRVSMCSLLCIAIVLQFSLTHGYLPYGSSDVLVRSPPVCPPNIALFCLLRALFVTVLHYFFLYFRPYVMVWQLPSLVAFIWVTELLPRYGGVVDSGQYGLWLGESDLRLSLSLSFSPWPRLIIPFLSFSLSL